MAIPLPRFNRWLSGLGAVYALVAVVYFFLNFAANLRSPVRDLLPSMTTSLVVAVTPYVVLYVAACLALDRRVGIAIAIVTGVSLMVAVPLYAGAFFPAQDGEFMYAFVLVGLPTIALAIVLAVLAVIMRSRGALPSNSALLTDTSTSPLRAQRGAAKRERYAATRAQAIACDAR